MEYFRNKNVVTKIIPFIIELRILTRTTRQPQSIKREMNKRIKPTAQSSSPVFANKKSSRKEENGTIILHFDFFLLEPSRIVKNQKLTARNDDRFTLTVNFLYLFALFNQRRIIIFRVSISPTLQNFRIELEKKRDNEINQDIT